MEEWHDSDRDPLEPWNSRYKSLGWRVFKQDNLTTHKYETPSVQRELTAHIQPSCPSNIFGPCHHVFDGPRNPLCSHLPLCVSRNNLRMCALQAQSGSPSWTDRFTYPRYVVVRLCRSIFLIALHFCPRRLLPISPTIPRTYARSMGEVLWPNLFYVAGRPAVRRRLRPEDREGPGHHKRRRLLISQGYVHQVSTYLRPPWHHCYALRRDLVRYMITDH